MRQMGVSVRAEGPLMAVRKWAVGAALVAVGWFGVACESAPEKVDAPLAPIEVVTAPEAANPPIRRGDSFTFEMGEFVSSASVEQDRLEGTGIVDQLPFTGDQLSSDPAVAAEQQAAIRGLLDAGLIADVDPEQMRDQSIALVKIYATFPNGREPGTTFDIIVVPAGNATEIKFGRLQPTKLFDTGQVASDACYGLTVDVPEIGKRAEPLNLPAMPGDEGKALVGMGMNGELSIPIEPTRRAAAYIIRDGGYLVRRLPPTATSDATIVFALGAYNSDMIDGMRAAIRQRYPFDVAERDGGLGGGRLHVRVAANFTQSIRQVIADIEKLHFTVAPRTPLVVFDNREQDIEIVRGPIRLQKRWMATAHVPVPGSATAGASSGMTFAGNSVRNDAAPGTRTIPYIIAAPTEDFAEIKKQLDAKNTAGGGAGTGGTPASGPSQARYLAGVSRLRVITWPKGPDQPEQIFELPRNDLATILAFLRDELYFPPVMLKDFCLDAVKGGYIDAFVHERLPRRIFSDDRVLVYFPDRRKMAVGTWMVPADVIEGASAGTWDLKLAAAFSVGDVRQMGPFLGVIEGNTFSWREADGTVQSAVVRLSDATLAAIFRRRTDMVVEDADHVVPTAIDNLTAERDRLADVMGIAEAERLARIAKIYDAKIDDLRRRPLGRE